VQPILMRSLFTRQWTRNVGISDADKDWSSLVRYLFRYNRQVGDPGDGVRYSLGASECIGLRYLALRIVEYVLPAG
jgi:hypothetical protein